MGLPAGAPLGLVVGLCSRRMIGVSSSRGNGGTGSSLWSGIYAAAERLAAVEPAIAGSTARVAVPKAGDCSFGCSNDARHEHTVDRREDLFDLKRLRHVAIHPRGQATFLVAFHGVGRHRDDR